ncbi:CPBP family intramembrane glutamic endopeptidase [Nocardiopsis alba]|uniref:CPBP family intramembrane glutamic endopeptidase n=1 Tax=Nocardiopsis alba TaxID=53437 RepID=UPI0035DF0B0C
MSPEFSMPALVLAFLLVAYYLCAEPLWGKRAYERLERERDSVPGAYTRFLSLGMVVSWVAAGSALLAVALSPGAGLADLGMTTSGDWGTYAGMLVGMVIAGAAVLLVARSRGLTPPDVGALLPRNGRERRYAAGIAVTAGICEEIVFRGLFIAVGVSLGLPLYVAAGASLAIFTLAHLYQGPKAMAGVALMGLAFTYLYLSTGSLLVAVIAHAALDLRALLLTPTPRRADRTSENIAPTA